MKDQAITVLQAASKVKCRRKTLKLEAASEGQAKDFLLERKRVLASRARCMHGLDNRA